MRETGLREEMERLRYRVAALEQLLEVHEQTVLDHSDRLERQMQELVRSNADLEQFDRLFVVSLDMLCIAGFDGYFKRLNPAWERTLGLTQAELLGKSYVDFIHPDDRERTAAEVDKVTAGATVLHFENRYRHRDGSYRWFSWTAAPVIDEQLIYAAARDVTESKATEEELARSNADLEQFAYAASHDLQEPLRAVAGYCQLLQRRYKDKLDDHANDYIKNALEGSERMHALIHDLLEFARVTREGALFQPTDCQEVVRQAMARLTVTLEESGTKVQYANLPSLPADKGQLIRLLQNLIANAVKFRASRPSEVRIAAKQRTHEWLFSVQDNGIGIEPKYYERIFLIFQRLHTRDEYPGTGIGLAVCKRIVERHGGRIWVESTPGQGSTFYFTLAKHER